MSGRTITRLSSKTLGSLSLAQQFFLAGGLVTLGATVLIGLLVTDQIVETVTRNAGSTTALYVDSIIAPILPDLTRARTVALNERLLRKIGADLHDGPAQLIAYAALRVDSEKLVSDQTSRNERESETTSIKASLDEAIRDIRNICRGLVLPDIENLPIEDVVGRAVEHHQSRAGTRITTSIEDVNAQVGVPVKICAYRFVQEGLNNGWRHAASTNQCVSLRQEGTEIVATVSDGGSGFSFDEIGPDCIGLSGLKERIESLGGRFEVQTSARGTHLTMRLNTVDVSDP